MADFFYLLVRWCFLPIIITIGILTSVEDFRTGKIPNKYIKLGIVLGLFFYFSSALVAILFSLGVISFTYYQPTYYLLVLSNTILAFIVAFILWYFKLWAGGDAKLFTLFVFLIPLEFYSNWYFKYWPGLCLLINIILPIFGYLLVRFLFYPVGLAWKYLKSPGLWSEYYQKFTENRTFDKNKVKEYVGTIFSFLLILIFFQLLRMRLSAFLSPYMGQILAAVYFLIGFVVFQPLRTLLQKKIVFVFSILILYFIAGAIFFQEVAFSDFHKIFALQFIFILAYYFIFKYGQSLAGFLYNSAEVKMIPLSELRAGVYLNKDYLKKIFGNRSDFESLKLEIETRLDEVGKGEFSDLLKARIDQVEAREKIFSAGKSFRLTTLILIFQQAFFYKKQSQQEKIIFSRFNKRLDEVQRRQLYFLLNRTDEAQDFLKSLKGRLNDAQVEQLKVLIEKRNQEVQSSGLPPVDNIILHKTFSFAPWMLLGVLITIITKSSLIHLVYLYILHKP